MSGGLVAAGSPQKGQQSEEVLRKQALAEDLVHWFAQHGGSLSADVRVAYTQLRGFHLQASRPLSSPIAVTCPLRLTLSCLNLDPQQKEVIHVDSPLRQCRGKIPDHILTYLLLIEQKQKGKDSPWHAYIRCLPGPETMTTPLWFDDEDMAYLVGTSLAPAVKERQMQYQKQWTHALCAMKDASIALADEITFECLLWAATIFTSRAFISTHILPDQDTVPILFPVVDILNHSVSAKVEWDFQPRTSFSLKLLDGESFEPGQELYNNYAPKQNDELLLGYGFCLEDNPIEQFPLKLPFDPQFLKYAQKTGLFEAKNVPFGMSSYFPSGNSSTEQHFLRAKGHPFGRYENCIPFLRGIPPYVVHYFFVETVLALQLDIHDIDVRRPAPRITIHIMALLHQALSRRLEMLSRSTSQQPQNEKQKYAKIYRDGQVRILESVRDEFQAAIDRIRAPKDKVPPERPVLITLTEALAAFSAGLPPGEHLRFNSGLEKHKLQSSADDRMTWTLLLICLVAYSLAWKDHGESMINDWLRTLYAKYPLPPLDEGIEDPEPYTFIQDNLSDFSRVPFMHETVLDATERLDAIGAAHGLQSDNPPADWPALIRGKTEHLGVRLIMWGLKVTDAELVPLWEDGAPKMAMYVVPWKPGGWDKDWEGWMYEE